MTVHNEAQVPSEDEASTPAGHETPDTDRYEIQANADEDVPVAAQEHETSIPRGDEGQARAGDTVRFIVGPGAPADAQDEIEVIGGARDETPEPLEEEVLVPPENEVQVIVEEEAPHIAAGEPAIPIREVEKEEQSLGRRKHARFHVKGGAKGRVAVVWDAVLLNLSLGGALIEHANVVRPGTPSSLELELQGKKIRLRCRVARSVADRIEVQPDGERELMYHTGLQFVEPSDDTIQAISDYLHSIT